jgi:NOL1/NOP2/sun family putative RNA methylase
VNHQRPRGFERYREIIPDYEDFLEALRQPPAVFIRANTLKIDVESFPPFMRERGYDVEPVRGLKEAFCLKGKGNPGATLEYFLGYYHIQGLTSMLPARILNPQPDETILDLCAAPGGKATHLAQRMRNRGLVVANDNQGSRVNILRSHIDRLGASSLIVCRYNGQDFPRRVLFHRALLDPPCSAEGTYRLGPRPFLRIGLTAMERLNKLQRALLHRALDVLKPEGTLVYSTCTYAPEENEAVVSDALMQGRAELLPISIPFPHAPGLNSWAGERFHPELIKAARFYPHHVNSWGFFIAHLRKRN